MVVCVNYVRPILDFPENNLHQNVKTLARVTNVLYLCNSEGGDAKYLPRKIRKMANQRTLSLCLKVVDNFNSSLLVDGMKTSDYEGYVPDFFPGNHFGDYVELEIDVDTGQILNWNRPTKKQLSKIHK